jgi:hypothetical protein
LYFYRCAWSVERLAADGRIMHRSPGACLASSARIYQPARLLSAALLIL